MGTGFLFDDVSLSKDQTGEILSLHVLISFHLKMSVTSNHPECNSQPFIFFLLLLMFYVFIRAAKSYHVFESLVSFFYNADYWFVKVTIEAQNL